MEQSLALPASANNAIASFMHRRMLAALAIALLPTPALAATLVENARGIQITADGKIDRFTGLVINDQGKVVQVLRGSSAGVVVPIDRRVDVGGRALLPGLIDAHGHVVDAPGGDMGLGLMLLRLDLTGSRSLAEMQERLRTYAAASPGETWLLGRGWNQELFADKTFPTAADIDAIVPDRPVLLARIDGHAAVANSAAMKAAGLTAATRDPEGGKIERDASGRATGLLIDNAMSLVSAKVPPPSAATMDRALEAAQNQLLAMGITTAMDMGTSPRSWDAMRRLGSAERLRIRIISYSDSLGPLPEDIGGRPSPWLYGDRLRMVGVKIYSDGALGSRGAWLKRTYADQPDTKGLRFLTDDQVRSAAMEAAQGGFQVAIHAIGDAANAQAIGTFAALNQTFGTDRRWRIEHFQVADPADIPRLAPAGIIASMQPTHQTSDRLMAEKRLGPDRLAGAYAWRSVLKSGARIAFGSDFPVESPNPFPGLAAAISRQDINGQPPGGWLPEQRVGFEQALSGFTRDAAYAGFAEQKIGALEPGKWADFIIVDRDISEASAMEIARTQVLETWVAGKKVWGGEARAGAERGK
jgi:predicted amidohydrolase YtcJ